MIVVNCNETVKHIKRFWNGIHFHPTDAIEDDWGREILDDVAADRVADTVRIYAMLEDKNINDYKFNLETLKDILQFSNLDNEDKRNKINDYFKDKSNKCKEMLSVYLTSSLGTANSFMSYVLVHVNMLTN